jgi:hypothetical protein
MTSISTPNMISGRGAFIELLQSEGVTRLFGNPGTTELPIMHALTNYPDMHYVLGLQEAIVIAMADGCARASGELVACNVHVVPRLGNAIGSLFTASSVRYPTSMENAMPTTEIHVCEGRYDEQRLAKLGEALHGALAAVLKVPPEDYYRVAHILPSHRFVHTPSFLGLKYSEDFILLKLTFIAGGPKETRLALLKPIFYSAGQKAIDRQ